MLFTIRKWNETGTGGETVFDKVIEDGLEHGSIKSCKIVAVEQNLSAIYKTRCDDANKN